MWRRPRGISSISMNTSKAGAKKVVSGSSVMPSNRMRSNRDKLKHMKFHLNMRKDFLTLRVAENTLPRRVVESPSLERFKIHLHVFLCHLL